jgi:glycerol uptake facilitator-like aquaporin
MYQIKNEKKKIFIENFILKGILIEFLVTFVLVTVVLMVALDTKSKTGLAPVLIGFTLAVNILAM